MVWGRPLTADLGTGTSGQVEEAHEALDELGVPPGKLALRVLEAVAMLRRQRGEDGKQ